MRFIEYIRDLFKPPSHEILALKELEESKRKLLESLSAREWADSSCRYLETKIKRLTIYLNETTKQCDRQKF